MFGRNTVVVGSAAVPQGSPAYAVPPNAPLATSAAKAKGVTSSARSADLTAVEPRRAVKRWLTCPSDQVRVEMRSTKGGEREGAPDDAHALHPAEALRRSEAAPHASSRQEGAHAPEGVIAPRTFSSEPETTSGSSASTPGFSCTTRYQQSARVTLPSCEPMCAARRSLAM